MRVVAKYLLLFLQVIFVIIAIWQWVGLLPALTWFSPATRDALGPVMSGMWLAAGIKLALFLLAILLWFISGKLRRRLSEAKQMPSA